MRNRGRRLNKGRWWGIIASGGAIGKDIALTFTPPADRFLPVSIGDRVLVRNTAKGVYGVGTVYEVPDVNTFSVHLDNNPVGSFIEAYVI